MADINKTRLRKASSNRFMLHSADSKLAFTHVKFWLEAFVSIGQNFSILVRDEKIFIKLSSTFPSLEVCYAKTPLDVEEIINTQPLLQSILYTSNSVKNIHLLRFNHLKHIFIGTKNSDWLSSFNKSYRAYDEFWAGGTYTLERLQQAVPNLGHLTLKVIGKPQTAPRLLKNRKNKEDVLFLYVNKDSKILLEIVYYCFSFIPQKMYVVTQETKKLDKLEDVMRLKNQTSFLHRVGNEELVDEFISEKSIIILDGKQLNPYMLLYNVPLFIFIDEKVNKYMIFPEVLQDVCYFFTTKEELLELLQNVRKNDSLEKIRKECMNYLFNEEAIVNNTFLQEMKKI